MYLVIQVRAIGLSPALRDRMDKPNFRDTAFFALMHGLEDFMSAYQAKNSALAFERASRFRMIIWECRRELAQVHKHLDEFGVSINLVFQMMRLRTFLQRIDSLLEILITEKLDGKKSPVFFLNLSKKIRSCVASVHFSHRTSLFSPAKWWSGLRKQVNTISLAPRNNTVRWCKLPAEVVL